MELKWLGTAGFEIKTKGQRFLVDPFLSRNETAYPIQTLSPEDIQKPDQLFISHGHFDHTQDVPEIARLNQCDIFCSSSVGETLKTHQVNADQIKAIGEDKTMLKFKSYRAQAFFSQHIQFNKKLVFFTLLKINLKLFKYASLFKNFPCSQVLSWRFYIEDKIVHFFGTAGSSDEELETIKTEPIDILLLPMQGHSDICTIGTNYVKHLKPKIVIVQHHDNFYPPISKNVNIQPFLDEIKKSHKNTQVIVPQINEPLIF